MKLQNGGKDDENAGAGHPIGGFEPFQLINAMTELRMSVPRLALICNVHTNTVTRWRRGKVPIPGSVAAYVRLRLKIARIA